VCFHNLPLASAGAVAELVLVRPMRAARLLPPVFIAFSLSGCATREDARAPHDFSAEEAYRLANTYRILHITGCGGTKLPVARQSYWELPLLFGIAAAPRGSIHVDRRTGTVSYSWRGERYPTLSPKQLWDEEYAKEHRTW